MKKALILAMLAAALGIGCEKKIEPKPLEKTPEKASVVRNNKEIADELMNSDSITLYSRKGYEIHVNGEAKPRRFPSKSEISYPVEDCVQVLRDDDLDGKLDYIGLECGTGAEKTVVVKLGEEERFGEIYRDLKVRYTEKHINAFLGIVKGKKPGKFEIRKTKRGMVVVEAITPQGMTYNAISYDDGKTTISFSATKKDPKRTIINYHKDTSEASQKMIGNLVEKAMEYKK